MILLFCGVMVCSTVGLLGEFVLFDFRDCGFAFGLDSYAEFGYLCFGRFCDVWWVLGIWLFYCVLLEFGDLVILLVIMVGY